MVVTVARDGFEHWLYLGRPLRSEEIIKWLIWSLPRHRWRYCGFFFGYDQNMILQTVPEDVLRRLYRTDEKFTLRTPSQLASWDRYINDRFATRITLVCPVTMPDPLPDNVWDVRGPRIDIWDVGKFYTKSFAKVLNDYPDLVTAEERAFVARMKGERRNFDPTYWEANGNEIVRYSLLENKLLARIQDRFDRDAADQGYPLTSWFGAGSLAKSMLKAEGVVDHLKASPAIPDEMREPVDWSYFGGRFEILGPGVVDEEVWEYDIKSAYPASYRDLPCRVHGTWVHRRTPSKTLSVNDLYHVKWNVLGSRYGPFPVRDAVHKSVCYPWSGEGWFWGHEVIPARAIWGRKISLRDAWVHRPACGCRPFEWIAKPFQRRQELGESAAGYPLKIGMNAVYGTLVSPLSLKYWDAVWGSMITSWTRGQLLGAMALTSDLDRVLMLATDAIYTTEQIPLPLSDRLGCWTAKSMGIGGILIQPGLYCFPGIEAGEAKFKSRGINQQDVIDNIDRFYDEWQRNGARGTVQVPLRPRFVGIRSGLNRNKLAEVAWRWTENETRAIAFDPVKKRQWTEFGWMPRDPVHRPQPYHRFLATWEPERYFVPDDTSIPVDLLEIDQPDGPMT